MFNSNAALVSLSVIKKLDPINIDELGNCILTKHQNSNRIFKQEFMVIIALVTNWYVGYVVWRGGEGWGGFWTVRIRIGVLEGDAQ